MATLPSKEIEKYSLKRKYLGMMNKDELLQYALHIQRENRSLVKTFRNILSITRSEKSKNNFEHGLSRIELELKDYQENNRMRYDKFSDKYE
jgi:hypothetical protein